MSTDRLDSLFTTGTQGTSSRCDIECFTRPFFLTMDALKSTLWRVRDVFNNSPATVNVPWSMRTSSVPLLNASVSPTAVISFVSNIVVNSVQCLSWLGFPHISPKIYEIRSPFNANFNASTSITRESSVIRVMTTGNHCFPDCIDWPVIHSMPSIKKSIMAFLAFCASATPKMRSFHNFKTLTFLAKTHPLRLTSFGIRASLNNSPKSKFLSRHVFHWFHTKPTSGTNKLNSVEA